MIGFIIVYYFAVRQAIYALQFAGSPAATMRVADTHAQSADDSLQRDYNKDAEQSAASNETNDASSQSSRDEIVKFLGEGVGYKGKMTVEVSFKNDEIIDVIIAETNDDSEWLSDVEYYLLPAIVDAQSADIDVVAGATFTSNGVLTGVKQAIEKKEASQQ